MFDINQNITPEDIKKLPLYFFQGEIDVAENTRQADSFLVALNNKPVLGFDTETKPTFRKGKKNQNSVALLQFSTFDRAYLFRLNKTGIPDSLINILTDKNILKIGVAVKDDILKLRKIRDFEPNGFIDLREYVKQFGIENYGIKKLSALILQVRISKSQQLSNWENDELSPAQLRYAATDAWACYEIYKKLSEL